MQNMSNNLLLFCAPTWPSHPVIDPNIVVVIWTVFPALKDSNFLMEVTIRSNFFGKKLIICGTAVNPLTLRDSPLTSKIVWR